MTRKQRTKNKMADSECGLRHHYLLNLPIANVYSFRLYVTITYNHSGLLKMEIQILLRLARFQNLGTPPKVTYCIVDTKIEQIYSVCDRIEKSGRTGTGPDWGHFGRNRTGLQA